MILAYARVSTVEQAEDGTTSIDTQIRKCKAIADLRGANPYDFITYVDGGVSGGIPLKARPEGAKLLADAKKGDVVVAAKMDRLFRSATDALGTADSFRRQGIHLVLVDMGVDPVTANGSSKMFFGMLAVFAEFERERIAERMIDGKRAKAASYDGRGHSGGVAPFGYAIFGSRRDSRLEPVEAEQRVLARLAELKQACVVGKRKFSVGQLMRKIHAEGHRARNGKLFQIVQIQRILQRIEDGKAGLQRDNKEHVPALRQGYPGGAAA
jgi:DNA invertase Pin-like site-specific DNA recombinase